MLLVLNLCILYLMVVFIPAMEVCFLIGLEKKSVLAFLIQVAQHDHSKKQKSIYILHTHYIYIPFYLIIDIEADNITL